MKWFFNEQTAGEMTRDPIIGEFFSTDAIDNPAEALVREGIQNSLDARLNNKVKIHIRILLIDIDNAPVVAKLSNWFSGAWDHLRSNGNGLKEIPSENEKMPFLVFEDFGTTGLQGDINQAFDEPENHNSFFYFFRAEGRSGKKEMDRGRWGIGKHVFPRASRISTYFGLTVRADDKKHLLMGHSILKSHKLENAHFTPDGFWGVQMPDSKLILPVSDTKMLSQFCKDFKISRVDQPGLSVVVPYSDKEISLDHLISAVISDYFYPILKGDLDVEISNPNKKIRIDSQNIIQEIELLGNSVNENLLPLIKLAKWAVFDSIDNEYQLEPSIKDCPEWSDDLIPEDLLRKIHDDLENGRNIALRIGIKVQKDEKSQCMSYFHAYLCKDGFDNIHPTFIREGIIISDVRSPRPRGIRSIIIIEDKPIATLLGDSENPAHTQWQKDSSNFKDKYKYGKYYIEFVTKFVSNLVNTLGSKAEQEDPDLLIDIFSLPSEKIEDNLKKKEEESTNTKGTKTGKKRVIIEPSDSRVLISKLEDGGFKISKGDSKFDKPFRLDILVAYNLRKGNPLNKYTLFDFQLENSPIDFKDSLRGVTLISVKDNHIMVDVIESDFQLIVKGFDVNRDLYIRANVVEVEND